MGFAQCLVTEKIKLHDQCLFSVLDFLRSAAHGCFLVICFLLFSKLTVQFLKAFLSKLGSELGGPILGFLMTSSGIVGQISIRLLGPVRHLFDELRQLDAVGSV